MSKKKIAFLFPGQGAQYVGMGKDFYDQFDVARHTFQEADELLGSDFSNLIFNGPADELTLTKNSQLAIYIVSIAILRTFQKEFPDFEPTVCAGLSLGEYTALTAAGKISFADCLRLVQARGLFMQEACVTSPGTMRVVLGMEPSAVQAALSGQVWVANLNCPGQVVIAGTLAAIEPAANTLKEKGAKRVLPLDVSGAFHTPLMREAQARLKPLIDATQMRTSSIDVVMNALGAKVSTLEELKTALTNQVTSSVLWEKGIRAMEESGIELYIEMGCGKTLAGMNKKIGTAAPTLSIEKVTDLTTVSQGVHACS